MRFENVYGVKWNQTNKLLHVYIENVRSKIGTYNVWKTLETIDVNKFDFYRDETFLDKDSEGNLRKDNDSDLSLVSDDDTVSVFTDTATIEMETNDTQAVTEQSDLSLDRDDARMDTGAAASAAAVHQTETIGDNADNIEQINLSSAHDDVIDPTTTAASDPIVELVPLQRGVAAYIIDHKIESKKTYYNVHWENTDQTQDSWETESKTCVVVRFLFSA